MILPADCVVAFMIVETSFEEKGKYRQNIRRNETGTRFSAADSYTIIILTYS